jgi:hypothetical protein
MPLQKLEVYSEVIFLTLFLRLANESDSKCRDLVSIAIKKLVAKSKKNFSEIVLAMSSDSAVLTNGKLQLLSLFASIGKLSKNDFSATVAFCAANLSEAVNQANSDEAMIMPETQKRDALDIIKPESLQFLKGIGLDSDSDDDNENENDRGK